MARKSSSGRKSGCLRNDGTHKAVIATAERAERHAKRMAKVYRTGRELTVFPCDMGPGWHVGRKRSRRG
jgi:hypothetical protein